MVTRVFEWRKDYSQGREGWILKGSEEFNITDANGRAHDVLEHFTGKTTLKDEMLAYGAMLLIRGLPGWFSKHTDKGADWHMGVQIAKFIADERGNQLGRKRLPEPPKTPPLDSKFEELLEECLTYGYTTWGKARWANTPWVDAIDAQAVKEAKAVLERMRGWIRIGYRRAQRRWKGHTSQALSAAYQDLLESVDNIPERFCTKKNLLEVRVEPSTLNFEVYLRTV